MTVDVDVAVIGAGPVGLFAVFACGQLGLRCAVIDALADPGGQLTALYPEKPIYDIPGRPVVRADELVEDLVKQAAPYEPVYLLGQQTADLNEAADGTFTLTTSFGTSVQARAIVIAAGVGAFGPNRPPLEGIRDYENTSVFYHVGSRDTFADRDLVIAGGGDSAVDWALSLAEVAKSITVVHRRDKFRAHPASVAAMHADARIEVCTPCQLEALEGHDGRLTGIRIGQIGGASETLAADALLALFGLSGDLSPLAGWQFAIEGKAIPVDPATCATSRAGVFAIGDVATYAGKRKLILTGFSEASVAALAAHARVFPGKAIHDEYSTTRGLPGLSPAAATQTA